MKEKLSHAWSGTKEALRIGLNPAHWVRTSRHFVAMTIRNTVRGRGDEIYDINKPFKEDKQTVVMLPGLGADGASLHRLGQELSLDHNVYSPDNLPRDLSAVLSWDGPAAKAERTAEFVERFSAEKNGHASIHFVGHSNGGLVGLLAMDLLKERAPQSVRDKIKSVITLSSPVRPHPDYHLASAPFIARALPASEHLRPDAPLYLQIQPYIDKLSLCVASDKDELFPMEMQYVPGRPMAHVPMSHWEYGVAKRSKLRHLAGLISEAIFDTRESEPGESA